MFLFLGFEILIFLIRLEWRVTSQNNFSDRLSLTLLEIGLTVKFEKFRKSKIGIFIETGLNLGAIALLWYYLPLYLSLIFNVGIFGVMAFQIWQVFRNSRPKFTIGGTSKELKRSQTWLNQNAGWQNNSSINNSIITGSIINHLAAVSEAEAREANKDDFQLDPFDESSEWSDEDSIYTDEEFQENGKSRATQEQLVKL